MLRLFGLLFLLTGFTLHAQQMNPSPTPAAPDDAKLYTVQGTVINGQTGAPLPHALVEVYGPSKRAALTDAEGHFSFEGFQQGPVSISVKKPGYFFSETRGMAQVNLLSGKKPGPLELKLFSTGVIFGQVTDNEGEPLEGVFVEALRISYAQGQQHLVRTIQPVRTDEDGDFRLGGLHSGRYYVRLKAGQASRRILGAQSKTRPQAYPALVYYPAATDLAAASVIDLAAGQRIEATFSLKLKPAFKLSGIVSGIDAYKQVNPPMIVDESGMPLFSINHWDQTTGVFEFPAVPAGTYSLRLGAMDNANHFSQRVQTITVDHDVTGLHLAFSPGVTVPVLVRRELSAPDESRNGSAGAVGDSNPGTMSAMVSLLSSEFGALQFSAESSGNSDGPTLAVRAVMPGKYRVHVTPMINAYVASIRSGSTDLLRDDLTVPQGGNVAPIEIVLRDDGGKIQVHVQSTSTTDNPRILLMPESGPVFVPWNLSFTEAGLELGNLAPGNYKVLAFDSIDNLEYENPEALEKYSIRAVQVMVSARSTTPVTVDLIHVGE